MSRSISQFFYPLAGAAIIILIWHYYVVLMQVPIVVLPTPLQVLKSMIDNAKILTEEGWVTALECLYGFALSLAIGIPIAVVMTYSRVANQMFYPLLVATQSIPKVAVAPILLVWFGTGIQSKLAMAFVIAFFPVVVDTATGLRSTSPDLLELARSLQCTRLQTFFKNSVAVGSAIDLLRRQDCRHVVGHWRCHRRIHRLERRAGKSAVDRQLATQLTAGVGFTDGVERAWNDSLWSCCAYRKTFDAVGSRRRPEALIIGCGETRQPQSLLEIIESRHCNGIGGVGEMAGSSCQRDTN